MITNALSLGDNQNVITHLNSTKEFFMLASPILRKLSSFKISSTAKGLWKVLLDLSKKTETLTCSYARAALGRMINRSVRTVTTLVAELEAHGFLSVTRGYSSYKMKKVNVYQLTIPQKILEEAMKTPDRRKRSEAMDRQEQNRGKVGRAWDEKAERYCRQVAPEFFGPPSYEEYGFIHEEGSAENCTIDKKEYINNNNSNKNKETESVLVTVPVSLKRDESVGVQSLLSDVHATVNLRDEEDLEKVEVLREQMDSHQNHLSNDLRLKLDDINKTRKELDYAKQHQPQRTEKITELTIKEKILCKDRDELLDSKDSLKKMESNYTFLYMLFEIVKKYCEYKTFYEEKKKVGLQKPSYSNVGYEDSTLDFERKESVCLNILSEIKADIHRHQLNARLAFFLIDPCFVGHDLQVQEPRIPKNVLIRYFGFVKEILKDDDKSVEVINEMAASVRFGELSRCKDEEGRFSYIKGLNVALKLLREGRWTTPNCVSVVADMIQYQPLNFELNGIHCFEQVDRQLQAMGLSK